MEFADVARWTPVRLDFSGATTAIDYADGFSLRRLCVLMKCGRLPAAVAATEFLHLPSGVDNTAPSGPKRVRIRRDLNHDKGIGTHPVWRSPLDCARTVDSRSGQEPRTGGRVLEDDGVVIGVNTGFHSQSPSCP
jgi:hypothetical protein